MAFGKHFGLAVLALSLACGSCASSDAGRSGARAEQASFERAARQHLPGTWEFKYSSAEPAFAMEGTSTYSANGTAVYEGRLLVQGQTIPMAFEGTWSVRGDRMTTVVTDSSMPAVVPIGMTSTDTINELTATVFRYTDDEEGITITETRVRP